jgi:Flp pilus assembly secretin CpaC
MSTRVAVLRLVAPLALGAVALASADAAEPTRRYLTVDRSLVIDVSERLTQVSVTNPAIADVVVITPNQVMVNGKAAGVTTLMVFHARGMESFELVVHPIGTRAPLVPSEARQITVQRGDKITNHLFVPGEERGWVELESSKVEPESPPKK